MGWDDDNYDNKLLNDPFWDEWRKEEEEKRAKSKSDKCVHEFVNMGFTFIKLVCKHCDMESK